MEELTAQDIKAMLAEGENINVEFKECGKALPRDFWPTYSSFANTHGGWIILGVKEHSDRKLPDKFEAVGVNDIEKITDELWTLLDNKQKVNRNLLTDDDVSVVEVDGMRLLVVHIPEADYKQKPIFLYGNKVDHSYKRTNDGDKHLTDEELALMLRDAYSGDNDFRLMEHYDMRHIDSETLRKYRTAFNLRNPGHVYSDMDDKNFLIHMGGYMIDEVHEKEGLTMAGVLMFGKGLVVRNLFPNFRMDYLDYTGIWEGSDIKWNERLTYDGRWENNLYNFITFVMNKITFGIPSPGVVKGMIRNDDSKVYKALRESVTNSIIHADFRIEGTLRIEKRDSSIELRNPGLLKLSREKIYQGKHSRARNPKIQDMLRMIGYGDNIGSGFPLILQAWREESWCQPELTEDRELLEITLKLKMSSLYTPETIEFIRNNYGGDYETLSPEEKECLVLIISEKCQTNSDLQISTGKNGWDLNRLLNRLTNKGFLLSHPNGRWTTYEPNMDFKRSSESNQKNKTKQEIRDNKENNKENNKEDNKENNKENIPQEVWDSLSDIHRQIVSIIMANPELTMQKLAGSLNITPQAIRTQRSKLESSGIYLVRVGSTKSGTWTVEYRKQ